MTIVYDRRKFLKQSAAAGAGLALMQTPLRSFATEKQAMVRVGLIAVGLRGQLHLEEMLKRSDVEVTAIADPDKGMIESALKLVRKYGKKEPAVYNNGNYDYRNLLKRDDVEAVIVASPWEWHLPHGIDAMNAKKLSAWK